MMAALTKACKLGRTLLGQRFYASANNGFIELRQYTLKPEGVKPYLGLCEATVELRKANLPFLGMLQPETGGALNKVLHFYAYNDFDHRDRARRALAAVPEWGRFLDDSRPHVASQAVYEIREYLLHPGYGTVPFVTDAFAKGLPHKVASDREGALVFFGHTDIGVLNNVLEIWRYPSAQSCIRAREAARAVQPWKECIAAVTPRVQWFRSTLTCPTPFSPWQ